MISCIIACGIGIIILNWYSDSIKAYIQLKKVMTRKKYTYHTMCTRCGMRYIYDIFKHSICCDICGNDKFITVNERFVSITPWYIFWKTHGYYIDKNGKVTGYYNEHIDYKNNIDTDISAILDYKMRKLYYEK